MTPSKADGSHRARSALSLVLWLVALHSTLVGILLMLRPAPLMEWAGFHRNSEAFFSVQNGVFHLVLAVGYALAAADPLRNRSLVRYTILVKIMAALFLLLYYAAFDRRWVILLSGVGDGAMAVVVAICWLAAGNGQVRTGNSRSRETAPDRPPPGSAR